MNYLSFLSRLCQNLPVPLGEGRKCLSVPSSQQSPWDLEMTPNPAWLWVSQGRCRSERRAVWDLFSPWGGTGREGGALEAESTCH